MRSVTLLCLCVPVLVPVWLWYPASADAQSCRRSCESGETRDARGCCLPAKKKPEPDKAEKKKAEKEAERKRAEKKKAEKEAEKAAERVRVQGVQGVPKTCMMYEVVVKRVGEPTATLHARTRERRTACRTRGVSRARGASGEGTCEVK